MSVKKITFFFVMLIAVTVAAPKQEIKAATQIKNMIDLEFDKEELTNTKAGKTDYNPSGMINLQMYITNSADTDSDGLMDSICYWCTTTDYERNVDRVSFIINGVQSDLSFAGKHFSDDFKVRISDINVSDEYVNMIISFGGTAGDGDGTDYFYLISNNSLYEIGHIDYSFYNDYFSQGIDGSGRFSVEQSWRFKIASRERGERDIYLLKGDSLKLESRTPGCFTNSDGIRSFTAGECQFYAVQNIDLYSNTESAVQEAVIQRGTEVRMTQLARNSRGESYARVESKEGSGWILWDGSIRMQGLISDFEPMG